MRTPAEPSFSPSISNAECLVESFGTAKASPTRIALTNSETGTLEVSVKDPMI